MDKRLYVYDGPVYQFKNMINENWHGETFAVSPAKALGNLAYQYKKSHGFVMAAKIGLKDTYLKEAGKYE